GYDNAGNIASLTDAQGNATSYSYDTAGHLLTKTDAAGNRTDNTYDSNGDLILSTLTPAAGANQSTGPQSTRFVYGLPGQLRFQISGTGIVTE
ncbi:hypothetical protein ACO0LF_31875, partial [Undibacterium sp. Di27W]|uniref:hypothetical protein n=1 Tax=Undibacterium sp. Di27W TaxID=3413036 RepID=UPI003BF10B56